jgi:ArsR family transcriptional regulator
MSKRQSAQPKPTKRKPKEGRQDLGELLDHRFFKALCDPGRVGLLVGLARSPEASTVGTIAACCPVDVSVVSRHLAMLRDAGILGAQKRGKQVHYSVRYPELAATLRTMAEALEACCPAEHSGKHSQKRSRKHSKKTGGKS